ncbi:hypothetical protein SC206_11900 [Rouxiella sp. T17]|uniref:hypothetical protein n=1 Tax=Rouxiella sp. T17 TaxID=3085684 RepID=UPI002FC90AAF
MPQPTKKYVFTEIVSDVNNYQQLLAYAIYKADKHLVATSLVDDFVSPALIEERLQQLHDAVADTPGIQAGLFLRAKQICTQLFEDVEDEIKSEARTDFIERTLQLAKAERSHWTKACTFVGEGLRGILATIITIILASGIYSLTLNKEKRGVLIDATIKTLFNTVNGDIPVLDVYRTELLRQSKNPSDVVLSP